jgi:hypothetical protein
MFSRSILKMLLLAAIFMAATATAFAAAPTDEAAPNSIGPIHTYLMPDLSLKSVLAVSITPKTETSFKRGTCHCSCGTAPCNTSADCGGNSRDQFISCCVKGEGLGDVQWFPGTDQTSRKIELPKFKGSCN